MRTWFRAYWSYTQPRLVRHMQVIVFTFFLFALLVAGTLTHVFRDFVDCWRKVGK